MLISPKAIAEYTPSTCSDLAQLAGFLQAYDRYGHFYQLESARNFEGYAWAMADVINLIAEQHGRPKIAIVKPEWPMDFATFVLEWVDQLGIDTITRGPIGKWPAWECAYEAFMEKYGPQ